MTIFNLDNERELLAQLVDEAAKGKSVIVVRACQPPVRVSWADSRLPGGDYIPWTFVLPAALIGFLFALCCIGGIFIVRKQKQPVATQDTSSTSVHLKIKSGEITGQIGPPLESRPAASDGQDMKDRIDLIKWILGLTISAAGLFTIAQGAASFFNATTFSKQAKDALDEANRVRDSSIEAYTDATTKFALLFDLEKIRKDGLDSLKKVLNAEGDIRESRLGDWEEDLYGKLNVSDRQKVLASERIVSIELMSVSNRGPDHLQTLRRLASFYTSKFQFEDDRSVGDLQDLERAEYLLGIARKNSEPQQSFYLENDLGNVYIAMARASKRWKDHFSSESNTLVASLYSKDRVRDAIVYFDFSKRSAQHKRPYYNLAYIYAELEEQADGSNFLKAVDILKQGLNFPNWELTVLVDLDDQYKFNLACYSAQAASYCDEITRKLSMTAEVEEMLKSIKDLSKVPDVRRELEKSGDFEPLISQLNSISDNVAAHEHAKKLTARLNGSTLELSVPSEDASAVHTAAEQI